YQVGQLAPVTVVLQSNQEIDVDGEFLQKVNGLKTSLEEEVGISSVTPNITEEMYVDLEKLPRNFLSEDHRAIKFSMILDSHPYELDALNTIQLLRELEESLLSDNEFSTDDFQLFYAGQTANQLDVKQMNDRDMILLFSLVTILLIIVLGFQTKSILMPILMMSTILFSYFATLGFGWWIFNNLMGLESISYRLPVYTFVFMV